VIGLEVSNLVVLHIALPYLMVDGPYASQAVSESTDTEHVVIPQGNVLEIGDEPEDLLDGSADLDGVFKANHANTSSRTGLAC
jgi:hypothetical protein